MNRFDYLALRNRVEFEVFEALKDPAAADSLVNFIMRHVVQANAAEQVRRQRLNRDFLTFRRLPASMAALRPTIDYPRISYWRFT